MISAYDDRNSVAAALERGANKFLTKPVNFPQLKSDVAAVIAEAQIGLSPEASCRAHLQVASAVGPLWVEPRHSRARAGRSVIGAKASSDPKQHKVGSPPRSGPMACIPST
jgi:DNA-binding response OmpR family regulator